MGTPLCKLSLLQHIRDELEKWGPHVRTIRAFVVLKDYEGAVSRWQSTLGPGGCCPYGSGNYDPPVHL
jgi:hypothetical protein